jgi:hypothetical protein
MKMSSYDETIKIVNTFLNTNASDIELSKMLHISASTIGRRLTNKLAIMAAFGQEDGLKKYDEIMERRKQNQYAGKIIGSQTSMLNNNSEHIKLHLGILFNDEEKQLKFLSQIALTFRAKLPLLAELTTYTQDELLDIYNKASKSDYESLDYLFFYDTSDQEKARADILAYYKRVVEAVKAKDNQEIRRLLRMVSDYDAAQVKIRHQGGGIALTDEEALIILKYQLKYALTGNEVAHTFDIRKHGYTDKIAKLLADNPDLDGTYSTLVARNNQRRTSSYAKR